ncbi:TIGR04372 family glycosyltransferase [Prochlorococcus marinus XMU1411]|uniref:TIGR04372 family glycosyltransferase n=1 Tax=Prochlorococcus marinus TaxID=1219 RepID=UPI001ADC4DDA|nr:TIGR04372 family glycosyltransferase [Prochlorococcus marinus]MBO8244242.1 TIGR04372 family glycosyltransferase [Prochlorococcus marinus XMU1411]MCR8537070.1 TIGR04372 family glycosyltransferase [Prochlorococcus marinus CUG1430]
MIKRKILFLDFLLLPLQALWETIYLVRNLPADSHVIVINSNSSFGWQVTTMAYAKEIYKNEKILNLQLCSNRTNKVIYKTFGSNFSQILYSPWSFRLKYRRGLDILLRAFFQLSTVVLNIKKPIDEDENKDQYSILIWYELYKIQRPKDKQKYFTVSNGKISLKTRTSDIFRINRMPRKKNDRLVLPNELRSLAKKIINEKKPDFDFDNFVLINDRKARSENGSDKIRGSSFEIYSLLIDQILKEGKSIAIYSSSIDPKIISNTNPYFLDAFSINNEKELINSFLLTECKQMISQNCGAIIVPWLSSIPILTIDHFPLYIELSKAQDIVMPLKFKKNGRYVSFKKIINKYPEIFQSISSSTLPRGFEVEKNSAKDLLYAYKNMYLTKYNKFPAEAPYLKRGKSYFYDYSLIEQSQ